MRRISYTITEEDAGRQVGALLKARLQVGRGGIRAAKFIDDGIMLDQRRVKTNERVEPGQVLSIVVGDTEDALASHSVQPVDGPLDIVFEDEDLIVLNKPAGISTHPGPEHATDTLGNFLLAYFQRTGQQCVLHPVQRLDWGTSGLIVFAKNAHAQDFLQRRLHTGDFRREYVAFCEGEFSQLKGTVDAPIGREGKNWHTSAVLENGKPARTHYTVESSAQLESPKGPMVVSRVRLQLETGRTHQIRLHMSYLGHPLLGDPAHNGREAFIDRPALHSAYLQLVHPLTGEVLELTAPFPPDLQELAAALAQ